jgi:hypothetical protein
MHQRFAKAMRVAVRDEGFAQIFGTGVLLVIVGTLTYTTSQDWSLVDGFYFAVATLTTSSIADAGRPEAATEALARALARYERKENLVMAERTRSRLADLQRSEAAGERA